VAVGEPLYVQKIVAAEGSVVVGPDRELFAEGLTAGGVNWIGSRPRGPLRCTARVRHTGGETPSSVALLGEDTIEVRFDEPVRAVAPGQQVVLYSGERVLAGGCIEAAL
jgi:tRNA-specific 2-thiouridylase